MSAWLPISCAEKLSAREVHIRIDFLQYGIGRSGTRIGWERARACHSEASIASGKLSKAGRPHVLRSIRVLSLVMLGTLTLQSMGQDKPQLPDPASELCASS